MYLPVYLFFCRIKLILGIILILDLTRSTSQKQMIHSMRLQEDMVLELSHKLIQITILITNQMRQLSDQVSSIQKDTQVQFIDQETHNKNSQMKEP